MDTRIEFVLTNLVGTGGVLDVCLSLVGLRWCG